MGIGTQIAKARQAKGLSQTALAELLDVSPEAVSKWEQNAYRPSAEKMRLLEAALDLGAFDKDGNPRNRRLFDEEHMSAFLKGKLAACALPEALNALRYAKEKHAGSFRKPEEAKVPYINHPLTMACHALALGLEDDALIAALLLHDVAEDCGVEAAELPFSPAVQRLVALVTKPEKPFDEAAYYAGIAEDPRACLVKCIDRCNNLSSMSQGFSAKKIAEYVEETERYFPPLLRSVKDCPEYNNAAWLLQYQIRSLLELAKRVT